MTDATSSQGPDGADRAADPSAATQESVTAADLEGRAAVITGGARGIGLAIAARLAGLGMKLCLADTDAGACCSSGTLTWTSVASSGAIYL